MKEKLMRKDLNYKIVKEKIVYFEDVFEDINSILQTIEELSNQAVTSWDRWDTGDPDNSYGEVKFLLRRNLNQVEDNEERQKSADLLDTIADAMGKCATEYSKIFNIDEVSLRYALGALKHRGNTTGINKYHPERQMGPHIDWNESNADVEYTIVVYLNDNYDGGELRFVEPELDVKIKPKAGSIVIFPSFMPYKHESMYVTNGRKMLITHHWKGGDRVKRIRHLLSIIRGTEEI